MYVCDLKLQVVFSHLNLNKMLMKHSIPANDSNEVTWNLTRFITDIVNSIRMIFICMASRIFLKWLFKASGTRMISCTYDLHISYDVSTSTGSHFGQRQQRVLAMLLQSDGQDADKWLPSGRAYRNWRWGKWQADMVQNDIMSSRYDRVASS